MTWKTAFPVGADTNRTEQRTWNTACPVGVTADRTTCAAQADESEGFSYSHGRLRPCRVIIVRYMYILDEDAEDTEDADDDRSSFHSRRTGGKDNPFTFLFRNHVYRRSSILLSCLLEDTS